MSGPLLLFVQVSSTGKVIDKKARHAIQKHVMRDTAADRRRKSKNIRDNKRKDTEDIDGETISAIERRSPKQQKELLGRSFDAYPDSFQPPLNFPMGLGGGRMDPFEHYPIKMDLEKLFLIDYVYSSSHPSLRPFRDTWLPLSKTDPGFFYEVLSHISQEVASLRLGDANYVESLRYHSLAMQSVNSRLADPVEGISDGIIGTILAFASFGHSNKDFSSYNSHIDGLSTIIRLRGGAHEIDHNRILRLLLSGIDVTASCFLGMTPTFPLPSALIASQPQSLSPENPWPFPVASLNRLWDSAFPGFPGNNALGEIFTDLSIVVMTIKSECAKRLLWQDTEFLRKWVDPIVHRYLEAESSILELMEYEQSVYEGLSEQSVVAEGCRLGALILLSKIRRRFILPHAKVIFTGVETDNLRFLLENYVEKWTVMKQLLLWASVLGAMETMESEDGEWYCGMVRRVAKGLGLKEWEEVTVVVGPMLWVGEVLDLECEELGRRVGALI